MLQCPKCGRTYETDTQKFCTHDGGRLGPYDRSSAPTSYDLNQTVRTDPFDPEATVTRMPDLNKTVASLPTSEIRPKETGPAAAPPTPHAPPQQQQPPPPAPREMMPTVAFNQPPPAPQQPPQQPPQQQYYAPPAQAQAPAAPPQQYQHPAPQYQHPAQPAQARKSSRAPLIIGLVVLALLGGLAAWYFLVYKKGDAGVAGNNANANTTANTNANAGSDTNTNATANANTAPTPPPANATEFVNSRANLDGKLAEYYSDFSFYYPNTWTKDPNAGVSGAGNFAKVDRQESPEFPQERFAVSYYESKGTFEADRSSFAKLVQTYSDRFAPIYPNYRKVSEGETTISGHEGYEFRFESPVGKTPKGDITYWGRVVFLPPGTEGQKNGITLLMLTSSLSPELKSADDVGIKGELPVILNSFKMGTK